MSAKIVPLISSAVKGERIPLLHLPRWFWKMTLDSRGLLADGYPATGKGFDAIIVKGMNIDVNAVAAFIKDKKPDYSEFESWIMSQPGVEISLGTIVRLNEMMTDFQHSHEDRAAILEASGLSPDDEILPLDAIRLNEIEDRKLAFNALTAV